MIKSFQQFLKESEQNDIKYRNIATRISVSVLKYVVQYGFDRPIRLSEISNVQEAKNIILIPIENENKLGNTLFSYENGKVEIQIRLDIKLLEVKTTFLKTLVHELIHALDMLRIPKESLIQIVGRSRNGESLDIKGYVNDALELNAFYQEIIFEIELEKRKFTDINSFIKYGFSKFPEFFQDNLTTNNSQKLLKRFANYYTEHF